MTATEIDVRAEIIRQEGGVPAGTRPPLVLIPRGTGRTYRETAGMPWLGRRSGYAVGDVLTVRPTVAGHTADPRAAYTVRVVEVTTLTRHGREIEQVSRVEGRDEDYVHGWTASEVEMRLPAVRETARVVVVARAVFAGPETASYAGLPINYDF